MKTANKEKEESSAANDSWTQPPAPPERNDT